MNKPRIIRVWGKADSFDIEFSKTEGGTWECSVPPDVSDGMYAVQIFAVNEFNEKASWSGFLYMCSGLCHLEITEKPFAFSVVQKGVELSAAVPCFGFRTFATGVDFEILGGTKIQIMKGCHHVRCS